ncbi:zinc-binding dehydrogenase [Candidatus Bathyarchaeota archaeon]|nr:MAG: zinc-binding dehydrogenase [Candidatus Bathyarchaeota archaeon]
MLACFLEAPRKVAVKDVLIPKLAAGDILVRMEASGICGTDLEKIEGQLGPGGILGHEVSGTIEKIADNVTDHKPGERVVAHHHVPCYQCPDCCSGNYTLCNEFKKTNIDPCGFAEYFRVPQYNVSRGAVIPLPPELSFEEGAMIEPASCCIRAIRRANIKQGDNVLVVGLGPTGLTQIQLLRHATTGKIIASDIVEARLRLGKKLGADDTINALEQDVQAHIGNITKDGVDLAIVSTGNEKALSQAFSSVRKGGRILLFGAPSHGASYPLNVSELFSRQITFLSSYSCVEAEMEEAIRLVSEKRLDLKSLITDRFKIRDAEKAMEFAKTSKTSIKTIILP